MSASESGVIRCENERKGRICGNILGIQRKGYLCVKRHGREVSGIPLTRTCPITLRCEKCGGITKIFL